MSIFFMFTFYRFYVQIMDCELIKQIAWSFHYSCPSLCAILNSVTPEATAKERAREDRSLDNQIYADIIFNHNVSFCKPLTLK